jgi:hypothetical protein
MTATARRLGIALVFIGLATAAPGASPDPFAALGLVRFDSRIRAPAFTAPALDGRPAGVTTSADRATILMFWTTW